MQYIEKYDAIFVDEAQDFSKVGRQLCLELVYNPKHLVLAADSGQSIYNFPARWIDCDKRFNFEKRRPILLSKAYRTTREISDAIYSLRAEYGDADDRSDQASAVFSGPPPRRINAPLQDHPKHVIGIIKDLILPKDTNRQPTNPGHIAIIVRHFDQTKTYQTYLQQAGIDCAIISKETPLQVDARHVHIVTAHSSKGLGFPITIVPMVSSLYYPLYDLIQKATTAEQLEEIRVKEQRLFYVALSRASHQLTIIVDEDRQSEFVSRFSQNSWLTN